MKKIKTESGGKISASYKTQLYHQWRERHKIDALTTGAEEGEVCEGVRGGRRGRGWSRSRNPDGKRERVGDLKTSEQILQKRKKRAFQTARKAEKQGRTSGKRGRGRGGKRGN